MSAQAGIFARAGQPIDPLAVERLTTALRRLGPDDAQVESGPFVTMVHRPLHVERESRHDLQPLVSGDGWLLSWDGRLDNAAEIRALVGDAADWCPSAAHLALAAYRKWGVGAFARLLGDFALAIWEPRRRQLVLACDSLGVRSLAYEVTDRWCRWATTARAVATVVDRPVPPDAEYLANFLVNQPSPTSAFTGIEQLPGGHALIVTPTDCRLTRYWAIDPQHRIAYASDESYEAHFRELFDRAIAARMQSEGPVFCELSGGLDSSAIACVAHRLHRARPDEMPELRTISYVFPEAKSADETPFVRIAEAALGAPGVHIPDDEAAMLSPVDPATLDADFPTPQLLFLARHNRAVAAMHAAGARVLLSGMGGDQMFLSDAPEALQLADLVVQRRWRELPRATRTWSYALSWPIAKTLWRGACWPLLPHRVQARFWRPGARARSVAEWFDPAYVRRMGLTERAMLIQGDDRGFALPSQSMHYGVLRQTIRHYALGLYTTSGTIEMRYPFFDRRIVEFALATPIDQKVRPHETRSIVRRALNGVVPDAIRLRRSKCGPAEAFLRALNRQWPWIATLLAEPRLCAHGVASPPALAAAFERARHGRTTNLTQLMRALSLELWLRSLEGSGSGARSIAA